MGLMDDAKRAAKRSADLAEMSDAKRIERLRAELAAKDKRFDDTVEAIDLKDKELIQERSVSRNLRKRVGELEGLFSHVGVETHKWFDPECGHEGCQSLVLKAQLAEQAETKEALRLSAQGLHTYVEALNAGNAALAEAKARVAEVLATDVKRVDEYNTLLGVIAAANARIAELENKNSYNLQIVREATARIAELDDLVTIHKHSCKLAIASAERAEARAAVAERINLEIMGRQERAEAEVKAMREALELVLKYAHAWLVPSSLADVARAALAPSPAGREERHEMTSIGDKEPD